jgi:hypothetical protein
LCTGVTTKGKIKLPKCKFMFFSQCPSDHD